MKNQSLSRKKLNGAMNPNLKNLAARCMASLICWLIWISEWRQVRFILMSSCRPRLDFDSQQLLTLFRGGQTIWLNEKDAAEIGVRDNDWCEVYNRNGVVISRAVVSPRLPRGVMFMYHAQDRHTLLDKANTETYGNPELEL